MQPFLAESAPSPGRALAAVAALTIIASMAMVALMVMISSPHRSWHHEHHQLPRLGQCMQGYVYLTR
jgi:hypothetical protein